MSSFDGSVTTETALAASFHSAEGNLSFILHGGTTAVGLGAALA